MLIGGLRLPPYGAAALNAASGEATVPGAALSLHAEPRLLENAFLRVELDAAGDIVRILDKQANREVLPPGAIANQWQAFEDRPIYWDAWDLDIFYEEKVYLAEPAAEVRVVEAGPLRAALEVRRRILNSEYVQRISLAYNSPVLDFDTVIDWRERHILLKAAFPVDVLSPVATHEIQWGSIQRPTHRNTSWDWARFETAAQKWVDLSEGDYGVALLNDCKYGHDIHDNVIRISLLRAPTEPDPEADQGEHRFAYSLFPHGPVQPGDDCGPGLRAERPAHRSARLGRSGIGARAVRPGAAQRHRGNGQGRRGWPGHDRAAVRVQPPTGAGHPAIRLRRPASVDHQPAGGRPGAGDGERPGYLPAPAPVPDRDPAADVSPTRP